MTVFGREFSGTSTARLQSHIPLKKSSSISTIKRSYPQTPAFDSRLNQAETVCSERYASKLNCRAYRPLQ